MELHLPRTLDDQTPGVSRRWAAGPRSVISAGSQTPQWRLVIAVASIIVLVALAGGSPRI